MDNICFGVVHDADVMSASFLRRVHRFSSCSRLRAADFVLQRSQYTSDTGKRHAV